MAGYFGDYDAAWDILEDAKQIFVDDSLAFCYSQGVISSNHNYKLDDGARMLQNALANENILKDNFIAPEYAFYSLAKIKLKSKKYLEAEKLIREAIERSPENEEFLKVKLMIDKKL